MKFWILPLILARPQVGKDPCLDYREDYDSLSGKLKKNLYNSGF